jgi:hypothetical protein
MSTYSSLKRGYCEPDHIYTGTHTCYRLANRAFWQVIGWGQFTSGGVAVCDDFGNLVQVQS